MKVLITGSEGQLGTELCSVLKEGTSEIGPIPAIFQKVEIEPVDLARLDITDWAAVDDFGKTHSGDLILNCAAMTDVDACETKQETAMKANAIGARNMAQLARKWAAKIIHVSTDYVFDGRRETPYTEWDIPSPATVYGQSKLLGERYVRETWSRSFIVRTAWLYGYKGNNFVKTILGLAKDRDSIRVVDDQRGNPTHVSDLAHHMLKIAATEDYGLYHCTGSGVCSWYEFAKEIVALAGLSCEVVPCRTEEFPRPAPRPAWSAMDHLMLRCTVGDETRPWQEGLKAYFSKKGAEE